MRIASLANGEWAKWSLGSGLLVAMLVALGCGGAEEAQLEEFSEQLAELHTAVDEAQANVDEREATRRSAEAELSAAQAQLSDAQRELAALEDEAGGATDTVLFRLVQRRLLDDSDLEKVGISAAVEGGVVELSGVVPSAELRDRAVHIASGIPGVTSVEDRIRVLPAVSSPQTAVD